MYRKRNNFFLNNVINCKNKLSVLHKLKWDLNGFMHVFTYNTFIFETSRTAQQYTIQD